MNARNHRTQAFLIALLAENVMLPLWELGIAQPFNPEVQPSTMKSYDLSSGPSLAPHLICRADYGRKIEPLNLDTYENPQTNL